MNEPLSIKTKSLLQKHNIHLKKSLGQNLLIDTASLERIIASADLTKEDTVIEIGMGTGLLTKELAKLAGKVIAFEIDKKMIPVAKEYLEGSDNVEIINEDFLKADITESLRTLHCDVPTNLKTVANVPYYITTPIIEKIVETNVRTRLIASQPTIISAVLTVQREFAERMAAKPGTKRYGSFSIFVNYFAEPEIVSYIPKTAFLPQPDVGSAIIRLNIRKSPAVKVKDEKIFFRAVRSSFGQRRKTLRNALQNEFDVKIIDNALSASGIDPKRRGETLSIEEFARLSDSLSCQP